MIVAYPRRAKRALGSEENSSCMSLIDSEMAGPIGLKLCGMVEDMWENVLAKEFFWSVNVDRGLPAPPLYWRHHIWAQPPPQYFVPNPALHRVKPPFYMMLLTYWNQGLNQYSFEWKNESIPWSCKCLYKRSGRMRFWHLEMIHWWGWILVLLGLQIWCQNPT